MANEFPMAQYLQAYQNKYANEQAAKPDLGQALAGGLTRGMDAGINMWAQEKEQAKQRAFEGFKQYTSQGEWYYGNDPEKKLSMEDLAQVYDLVGKGDLKFKTNKDGVLTLANKKGVPLNIYWKKTEMPIVSIGADGKPIIVGNVPKGSKVIKPATDKELINIDAEGRLFDSNMKPITDTSSIDWSKVVKNSLPNTITPSASEKDKSKLAQGGLDSVSDIRTVMKPDVFSDLKIAMLDPTGVYKQSMSGDSQKAYAGLRNAVGNILYIKTGAAATPKEIDEQLAKYSPTAAQSMEDWSKNSLALLERDLKYYQTKGGKPGSPNTPEQKSTIPTYATEADVEANPPAKGTKILIGGREAIWQ